MSIEKINGIRDLEIISNHSARYSFKELQNLLSKKFVRIYKLQKEDKIPGYAVVWIIGDEAELHWFEILEHFRGRGLAKPFLEDVIKKLKKEGVNKLLLEVSENNKVALKVYKKLGFKQIGVRKSYYPDGSNAILMEKEL